MEQQQGRDDGWLVEEKRVFSIVGGFYESHKGLAPKYRELLQIVNDNGSEVLQMVLFIRSR